MSGSELFRVVGPFVFDLAAARARGWSEPLIDATWKQLQQLAQLATICAAPSTVANDDKEPKS